MQIKNKLLFIKSNKFVLALILACKPTASIRHEAFAVFLQGQLVKQCVQKAEDFRVIAPSRAHGFALSYPSLTLILSHCCSSITTRKSREAHVPD